MRQKDLKYDVVVCGGGLAGFSAAIASARNGARTCLLQDRPVLGGNSSSEVRVTPHGAAQFHGYARETGIVSELLIEERARNHEPITENGWTNSVWDMVLYDLAMRTENLELYVNCQVQHVVFTDGSISEDIGDALEAVTSEHGFLTRAACAPVRTIESVVARLLAAETLLKISGKVFLDCTGDGVVADRAGCEWRMGTEPSSMYKELHAPESGSTDTMGNSIHFKAKDTGSPAPFAPPEWAMSYDDASFFYDGGRVPGDIRSGYWWIEIGVPWNTIFQAEDIRHELTRHCLGIWDWIKNKDPRTMEAARNYALDWIGQVPGKRESRRIMGRYLFSENDIQEKRVFKDVVAFGGWFVDLHTPGGLLGKNSEPASAEGYRKNSEYAAKSYVGPYGIPLRSMVAKDLDNLLMAGRNISATHAALGTARVMGTTALMGHASGICASLAVAMGKSPNEVAENDHQAVQQMLLREGAFIPGVPNHDPCDLARDAAAEATSEAKLIGVTPEDQPCEGGMGPHGLPEDYPVEDTLGQFIAVGPDGFEWVDVCLVNRSDNPEKITTSLKKVEHIWDYRYLQEMDVGLAELEVPPGRHWVRVPVGLPQSARDSGFVRLDISASESVSWVRGGRVLPACLAVHRIASEKMRRLGRGVSLSFRLSSGQRCFSACNVLSGMTRPHRSTNLWRSDPEQALPQSVQLNWQEPVGVKTVSLVFPGHIVREYHQYPPFFRDPQCPRDFDVEGKVNGEWKVLLKERNNYQRHRVLELPEEVNIESLKVVIHAINGDPSAAVYEIRCYSEAVKMVGR